MDQTQSYVENTLIECSRLSSIEHQSKNDTNNALFTNKIGSGIQLNVGDTISLHGAMISEVGAGSETIELKGKSLAVKQKFKYTKKTPISRYTYTPSTNFDGLDAEYIQVQEDELELKDNEAHLLISYYKTLNCENCFSLPRRFAYSKTHTPTGADGGVTMYEANDHSSEGTTINQIHYGTFIEEDYYSDRNASAVWHANPRTNRSLWKIRQDGLKYTVFAREKTFYNASAQDYLVVQIPCDINGSADPALDNYNRYVELKTITIPAGRRSADFIAESVTRQLQKGSDIRKIYHNINDTNRDTAVKTQYQGVVAGVYETDSFKLFTAHNGSTFSEVNYDRIKINGTQIEQKKLDWYSGFQYIAFKRPDFVEAGRATRSFGGFNNEQARITHITDNNILGRAKAKIEINLPYTEANCSLFSKFLKSQELYPEMWKIVTNASSHYYSQYTQEYATHGKVVLTPDNSRFLHLDMVQLYDTSTYFRETFGSDMMNPTSNSLNSIPSNPIFIVYDKSTENIFYENPEYDYPRTSKMSYGAFTKGPNNNIQFQFEGIGGIPNIFYNSTTKMFLGNSSVPDYDGDHSRRFMGYDFHFTAYGNAAVGLYNDMLMDRNNTTLSYLREEKENGDFNSNQRKWYNQMNKYYMGANNPKLTYDPTKDRFGFQGLYTSERKGNRDSAGATTALGAVDGAPQVYKINKRLRRQNYAPGMIPYSRELNASIYVNGSAPYISWELPNKAVYPFSVMDSHSGIFINSFGYNEDNWNNGLFKILGFSYDQLQADLTSSNIPQIRINTDNIDKLHQVTTEADVIAQDVLLYDENPFGGTMYHPVVRPTQLLWLDRPAGSTHSNLPWFPALSIEAPSNIITAEAVPKQMLRPFYCLRSSLLDDISAYYGSDDSGILLPTIGIVTKSTDSGDFFVGGDDSLTFTVTKPKVVTSITTAVTDPDGSFSRIDDNSAVIYKIAKNKSYPVDLLSTMFKKK